jgi:hypothetical protein
VAAKKKSKKPSKPKKHRKPARKLLVRIKRPGAPGRWRKWASVDGRTAGWALWHEVQRPFPWGRLPIAEWVRQARRRKERFDLTFAFWEIALRTYAKTLATDPTMDVVATKSAVAWVRTAMETDRNLGVNLTDKLADLDFMLGRSNTEAVLIGVQVRVFSTTRPDYNGKRKTPRRKPKKPSKVVSTTKRSTKARTVGGVRPRNKPRRR